METEVFWDHKEKGDLQDQTAKLDSRGKGGTQDPLACREPKVIEALTEHRDIAASKVSWDL